MQTTKNVTENLTKNFSLSEFERSDWARSLAIDNHVPEALIPNIKRLCEKVLQPLRDHFGVPIHINSGYRSSRLNEAVGGVPNSYHTKGRAADIPYRREWFRYIKNHLPHTELINEGTWIHVAFILMLVAIMLCSCKSAERSEVRHVALKHDTVYVAKGAVDSVVIKEVISLTPRSPSPEGEGVTAGGNSISEKKERIMDTIRVDRLLYKTKYRNDTVYVSRRDSVPYPVYVEKKVAYVPFAIKVLCGVGILTLLLLLMWIVWKGRGLICPMYKAGN